MYRIKGSDGDAADGKELPAAAPARGWSTGSSFVTLALPGGHGVSHSIAAPDVDDSMVPLSVDETKPDMPLPPPSGTPEAADSDEWAEATDENGAVYYYNPTTGESAWTKPTAMAME